MKVVALVIYESFIRVKTKGNVNVGTVQIKFQEMGVLKQFTSRVYYVRHLLRIFACVKGTGLNTGIEGK